MKNAKPRFGKLSWGSSGSVQETFEMEKAPNDLKFKFETEFEDFFEIYFYYSISDTELGKFIFIFIAM